MVDRDTAPVQDECEPGKDHSKGFSNWRLLRQAGDGPAGIFSTLLWSEHEQIF